MKSLFYCVITLTKPTMAGLEIATSAHTSLCETGAEAELGAWKYARKTYTTTDGWNIFQTLIVRITDDFIIDAHHEIIVQREGTVE